MTEKRYKAIPETGEYKDIVTGEFLSPKFEEGFYKVLDLLNENEQELKNQKDLNTVYTDFIKDKGYTIEDISKWSWKKYE